MKDTKRLGKGLSSLVSASGATRLANRLDGELGGTGARRPAAIAVPVDAIKPNARQPRRTISEASIRRLADSIQRNGVIQPVVVRLTKAPPDTTALEQQRTVKYELIAGERRWRAACAAGLSDVPAIIREADDAQLLELALVENIQREDLNAIDRALAYRQFKERFGLSPEEVGQRVGEDRTTVTNYLRLLDLPEVIREMVASNLLSMGHARALLGVSNEKLQMQLARSVVTDQLSVRALEESVRQQRSFPGTEAASASGKPKTKRAHIRDLENKFTQQLQTRVAIHEGAKKNKGKIVIEYNSLDDFDRICEIIGITA